MAIKFCVFDVGQVCYPYSLDPLNHLMRKMSLKKGNFDTYLKNNYNLTKYADLTEDELNRMASDCVFEGCDICGKYSFKE